CKHLCSQVCSIKLKLNPHHPYVVGGVRRNRRCSRETCSSCRSGYRDGRRCCVRTGTWWMTEIDSGSKRWPTSCSRIGEEDKVIVVVIVAAESVRRSISCSRIWIGASRDSQISPGISCHRVGENMSLRWVDEQPAPLLVIAVAGICRGRSFHGRICCSPAACYGSIWI